MSQENVEIVRAVFDAWNAGDMDLVRDLYDPDVIVRTVEDWPEPGPYVGREVVMRFFGQLRETWDADTNEPVSDFIDVADHVGVEVHMAWHGARPSGEHGVDARLHGAQGQDRLPRILLGSRRSPRNPGLSEQDAHADS